MENKTWTNRFEGQAAGGTGGADGLGFAIAQRLIAEGGTGWLIDRDESKVCAAAAKLGARARPVVFDIVDEPAVQRGFEQIYAAGQRLDVVVNSAAIVGPNGKKITETPSDGFEQVLRINLFGTFLVC